MSAYLPILNQWIIDPIQNCIVLPIKTFLLPIVNWIIYLITILLLPTVISFIVKQIKKIAAKKIEDIIKNYFEKLIKRLKYVFVSIKLHTCYPFWCDSIVEKLKKETEKLKEKRKRLKQSVDQAERNGEQIYDNVNQWLSCAETEIEQAIALIQGKEEAKKKCFFGLCPNLKSRYQLSKKAHEKALAIEGLRNKDPNSLPSRVLTMNQVMDALKDPKVDMILVHGTAGVGKSTLAKEVQRKALEEKLFDNVLWFAVSQTPDLRSIQKEIAKCPGLEFDVQENSTTTDRLLERSKALIILDDVWEKIVLNDLGIPSDAGESEGVKILLTSCRSDVLTQDKGREKQYKLEALEEEEAWKLFASKATNANDPELRPIARQVANKCGGHPLLIEIVAARLKTQMELTSWSETLEQLSHYTEDMFDKKLKNAFHSSYKHLRDEKEKSLFLLFPFFGQSNVPLSHLLTYAMGLGVVNTDTIQYARVKVNKLIKKFKTKSLLLDEDISGYVKMHNVLLAFARKIVTMEKQAFFGTTGVVLTRWPEEDCTRIALPDCIISELPEYLKCPKAELFTLSTKDLGLRIPDSFFQESKELKVLNLTGMCLEILPPSLLSLPKLRSLYLHQCKLDDVAMIGYLKRLKFLSFEASRIVELPSQIGQLTQLQSLNLTNCTELKVISPGVLSKLSHLEEMYMKRSFDAWDLDGKASVTDLDELNCLKALEVRVPDAKKLPNSLFSKGLERYRILIGTWDWDRTDITSRTLKLKLKTSIDLEDGLKKLLRGTEDLYLGEVKGMENNGLYDLDEEGFQQLKHLHVRDNNVIRCIINSAWDAFPKLETLSLAYLNSLKEICDIGRLGTKSFRKLRTLRITRCENLGKLFSFSNAKCLSQLQELTVGYCHNLEAIIANGSEDNNCNNEVIEFPLLSSLDLYNLPALRGICEQTENYLLGDKMVSFPNLTRLGIRDCNSLEYIFKTSTVKSLLQLERLEIVRCQAMEEIIRTEIFEVEERDNIVIPKLDFLKFEELGSLVRFSYGYSVEFSSLREMYIIHCHALKNFVTNSANDIQPLFNEMVSFPNLIRLDIIDCCSLTYIIKTSTLKSLLQLERLEIVRCQAMEEIIHDNIVLPNSNGYPIEFPSLREMHIISCHALKNFVTSSSNDIQPLFNKMVSFPNLTSLEVDNCNSLKYIFEVSTTKRLLQLKRLQIKNCQLIEEIIFTETFEAEKIVFQDLDFLELSWLPKLIRFSNGHLIEFQSLREMKISNCRKLKNFATNISNNSANIQPLFNEMVIFPNLQKMEVSEMYKLKYIWHSQLADDSFWKLKSLRIKKCSKLIAVFPTSNVIRRFQRLEDLELDRCFKMKEIYPLEEFNSPENVAFELRNLTVNEMRSLKRIWSENAWRNGVSTFPNLKAVDVNLCRVLKYVFPTYVAGGLSELEELKISSSGMANIVRNPEIVDPNFKWLRLKYLELNGSEKANQLFLLLAKVSPNIQTLALDGIKWTEMQWSEFPNGSFSRLKVVEVSDLDEDCGFLKRLGSLEKLVLKDSSLEQLFTAKRLQCLEIIGVNNLKHVWEGESHLSQYLQILQVYNCSHLMTIATSAVSFRDLTALHMSGCNELKNLVTPSTAETMRKLVELRIENCEMLTEIMANDEDNEEHMITFNQLERLRLDNLPRLNSFCSGDSTFSFPLLKQVIVIECPRMTIFWGGDLTAPKLEKVQGIFTAQKHSERELKFWDTKTVD